VYRVEVYLSNSSGEPPAPWIVSNPIYVEPAGWGVTAPVKPLPPAIDSWNIQGGPWHVERDNRSSGTLAQRDPPKGSVDFSYHLGDGGRAGQYAALAMSAGNSLTGHDRLAFRAVAAKPMRVSVQVRRPSTGDRWQRSVYLDQSARDIVVGFAEMTAVGTNITARFTPSEIDTILFVVDTTNTAPDSAGRFTVSDLRVEH
jgi:hypothetical protein